MNLITTKTNGLDLKTYHERGWSNTACLVSNKLSNKPGISDVSLNINWEVR